MSVDGEQAGELRLGRPWLAAEREAVVLPRRAATIRNLYVWPHLRGCGVAGRLLAQAVDWADATRHDLVLYVARIGTRGLTVDQLVLLYERHGFELVPTERACAVMRRSWQTPGSRTPSVTAPATVPAMS